jgi:hypothetical protein
MKAAASPSPAYHISMGTHILERQGRERKGNEHDAEVQDVWYVFFSTFLNSTYDFLQELDSELRIQQTTHGTRGVSVMRSPSFCSIVVS